MTDRRGVDRRRGRVALWALVVAIPLAGAVASVAAHPGGATAWAVATGGAVGLGAGMVFRYRLRDLVLDRGQGRRRGYAGHVAVVAVAYLVARQLPAAATGALMAALAGLAVSAASAAETGRDESRHQA